MGTFSGSTLINDLARRLRDTGNLGYSRTTVLDIINRAQRSLNAYLGLATNTATLVTTNAPLYSIPAIASDIVRIIEVRDGSRILTKIHWPELVHQTPRWMRLVGQPEIFAPIGRELLAIAPIPVAPVSLTITYVKLTTNLADAGAPTIDIPDEHKPLLLDIAETVLLFKGHEPRILADRLKRLTEALGVDSAIQSDRRVGDTTQE